MQYKIIDNFLHKDDFINLRSVINFNPNFPICLTDSVGEHPTADKFNPLIENQLWNWYGTHMVYDVEKPRSNIYELVNDLLLRKIDEVQKVRSLIRIKINFYPYTETIGEHAPHKDFEFSHFGAVFSLNTCNGFTRMSNGDKVHSVENRIVLFDPSENHNSSTTSNQKGRYNINLNWL